MQEHPSHYKNSKNTANAKPSDIICDDQVHLSFFYPQSELEIKSVDIVDNIVNIYAHGSLEYGICPYCETKSYNVHSHYIRHVFDLPILGKSSVLHLRMRKFFCIDPDCKYRTFEEQPGIEIFRYRRRTRRCEIVQYRNALKHSSNTSHKLLSGQGICLSGSAILRDLHRLEPLKLGEPSVKPEVSHGESVYQ